MTKAPSIASLMAEVDRLDGQLVELPRRRFHCSREIGSLKRVAGQARYDPARVLHQQTHFVELCAQAGLDEEMGRALIGTILQQVIAERIA